MLQILFALLWEIRFPVPDFLIQKINNVTIPKGLFIEIEETTFTLGGEISVRNARLKPTVQDIPSLCFIRRLDAHVKISSLLTGSLMPTNLNIEGVWGFAKNQETDPALENFSGTLHFSEGIVRFAFEGQAASSRIDLRGLWNTEMAFSQRKVPSKKGSLLLRQDFSEIYWGIIKSSEKAKALLSKTKQPAIGMHITVEDQCVIRLLVESGAIKLGSYEADSMHCSTHTEMDTVRDVEGSLLFSTSKLYLGSGNQKIGIGQIRARIDGFEYDSPRVTKLPHVGVKLEGLSFSGKFEGMLPPLHIEASPLGQDSFSLFAGTGTKGSKIIFTGRTQPLKRNAQGTLSISVKPHELPSVSIKDWAKKQILLTPNPIKVTIGPIAFQEGNFSSSKFIIKAEDLIVRKSPPARYRIYGKIDGDGSILAQNIYGKLKHSEVRGSFQQNWSNHDFRFLLEGRCMPTEINPWLKDWWDTIWQDFSWGDDIPYGDFDIRGQWLNKKSKTKTYGAVEFSRIDYRELPLDKGSLKVIVDEKKTQITEITLFPPTGKVEGNLSFPRSSPNENIILGFDLTGKVNPVHCYKAFGPVAEKALTRFDTNSTVNVLAKGQVMIIDDFNQSKNEDLTHFKINATAPNPIRFAEMPLEYLSLNLQTSSNLTHIDKLDFGIAGGRGSGTLLFREEQNGSELDIDLSITKANRSNFVEIMTLSDAFSVDKNSSKQNSVNEITDGILNLSVNASGRIDDIWSFEGNGSLLVKDQNLHKVRIFSSLAEAIGNIRIFGFGRLAKVVSQNSLGSIRFTELDSPFILNGKKIIFKNLNISGPVSLLVATGDINLAKGLLDLEARLHLLGNIPLVSKLTQLADPLSALGNIKIGGSFDKPTWNTQLRPGKGPLEVLSSWIAKLKKN